MHTEKFQSTFNLKNLNVSQYTIMWLFVSLSMNDIKNKGHLKEFFTFRIAI